MGMSAFLCVTVGIVVILLVILVTLNYFLLWKPSLNGGCRGQVVGRPDPSLPRLAQFRGEVVGKSLWIIQYRWLRRQFTPVGTTLDLVRELPTTIYQGNVVRQGEEAGSATIGSSGKFAFLDLTPGEYDLKVTYPGEDAVGFKFVIDPSASGKDVLIDASPAYYCTCCGWNFEPR